MPDVIDQFTTREQGGYVHGPFSNGYIEPDGTFVEREYQADKFLEGTEARAAVLRTKRPFGYGGSKSVARLHTRRGDLRPDWFDVNIRIMTEHVWRKFTDHPDLAQALLDSADATLIEGNTWHDNFWGNCTCQNEDGKHPECLEPGRNALGEILMAIRHWLRANAAAK